MSIIELFLTAAGLAMDAFAVSVCKGLALRKATWRHMLCAGAWFGFFQALMPFIGWIIGSAAASFVHQYSHWIAFALLALIGANMIRESFGDPDEEDARMDPVTMLMLAVATSIDALAAGASFAFLEIAILPAVALIGVVTFVISGAGVKIGSLTGDRFHQGAEIAGGVILILIGCNLVLKGIL